MNRSRQVLTDTLKKNKLAIILFALMTLLNGAVFYLYDLVWAGFYYSEALLFVILLALLSFDFLEGLRKAREREHTKAALLTADYAIPEDASIEQRDYGEIILLEQKEIRRLQSEFLDSRRADDAYYTAWVHQIKTPIAVMKLELSEDTPENRALLSELFRIEQYVEMVLEYVRLKSDINDLVIREYDVDEIIRETLRKFAPQFILKKLQLRFEPSQAVVVTDKKWLSFILEQLISNAIKYTPSGEIIISADTRRISVTDTGIGIAAEDLPRIFEKGYTGLNGRLDRKSSGLGLFLVKKATELIGAGIVCESTVGKGTSFTLTLPGR